MTIHLSRMYMPKQGQKTRKYNSFLTKVNQKLFLLIRIVTFNPKHKVTLLNWHFLLADLYQRIVNSKNSCLKLKNKILF